MRVQTTGTETAERAQAAPTPEDAVLALARVWSNSRLYPPEHPLLRSDLRLATVALQALLADRGRVTLKNLEGELVCDEQRMFAQGAPPTGLVEALRERDIGCITLSSGLSTEELAAFCGVLAEDAAGLRAAGGVRGRLSQAGVHHINVDRLALPAGGRAGLIRLTPVELYRSAVSLVRETMEAVQAGGEADLDANAAVIEEMVSRVLQDPTAAIGLASIKSYDEYTFNHSVRSAMLSLAFGDSIGLNEEELRDLGVAAMLHDVGKILVPPEVLRKSGRLSDEEWQLMQRHPADGAATLLDYRDLPRLAPVVAFEHHVAYDFSGYPLVRDNRPLALSSLIVSLVDVYDALTSQRPYRPALRPEQAAAEMAKMPAGKFEPRLARWFRQLLGIYPPGTCVELDTGELAVVCRANPEDPWRPDVCLVADHSGASLPEPLEVCLTARAGGGAYLRSVAKAVDGSERGVDASVVLNNWLNLTFAPEDRDD